MNDEELKNMTYEQKEAAQLITSMQATLRSAKQEVTQVFAEMEKQKESLGLKQKPE
jgi:hypothetical protein